MVKLTKIYTKTGDDGTTGLADATRRSKSGLRIRTMGSVEELNSCLGLARLQNADHDLDAVLAQVQNDLFDLGADLAVPPQNALSDALSDNLPEFLKDYTPLRLQPKQIVFIEAKIDHYNADLAPLNSFILPFGSALSIALHMARTTCRRAESDIVGLGEDRQEPVNILCQHYLNRLSDLLFVLARHANDQGRSDVLWQPSKP